MRRWPGGAAAAPQRRDVGGSVEDYLSEKEQWEWIKTQVRENGPAVIVAVAVVAAGVLAAVAENSKDRDLALVARLRLARVQIAQGKTDGALATLNAAQPGAFAAQYHEVRGDAYYAKGDKTAALKEYRSAQTAASDSLLTLKIADLAADAPGAAPAAKVTATAAKVTASAAKVTASAAKVTTPGPKVTTPGSGK